MKILILTPIVIEYNKVREHLDSNTIEAVQHAGMQYEQGRFQGAYHDPLVLGLHKNMVASDGPPDRVYS